MLGNVIYCGEVRFDETHYPGLHEGVVPEDDPRFVGQLTGATAEEDTLYKADLILTLGLDPIEMIPSPWVYTAPVGVALQGPPAT